MEYEKVYIEVIARFLSSGGIRPLFVVWDDGAKFIVDRVKKVERAPSKVASVMPMRYVCMMNGAEKNLYYEYESERWFVERQL